MSVRSTTLFCILVSAVGCATTVPPSSARAAPRPPEATVVSADTLSLSDREYAASGLTSGLVLARLGARTEILRGCTAPIEYRYTPGAAREPAGPIIAGRYRAARLVDARDWFEGRCDTATHYLSFAAVGGGSKDECANAASSEDPPPKCANIVRLELEPLPHKACPRYSVAHGDACRADPEGVAPPDREPFQVSQQGAAPPGLVPGQVEEFVRPKERDVEKACWSGRFSSRDSARVEYALSVDPGGNVFPSGRDGKPAEPVAELHHGELTETNPDLGRCVERVVAGWKFPRATTPTWLLINFHFEGNG
jgi:hypothetical protein